jgi:hypothetical protein
MTASSFKVGDRVLCARPDKVIIHADPKRRGKFVFLHAAACKFEVIRVTDEMKQAGLMEISLIGALSNAKVGRLSSYWANLINESILVEQCDFVLDVT